MSAQAQFPTTEIIERARAQGVDFGRGSAQERIRYFIKLGLLPKAVKQSVKGSDGTVRLEGHLPLWVVDRLVHINTLNKSGLTVLEIKKRVEDGVLELTSGQNASISTNNEAAIDSDIVTEKIKPSLREITFQLPQAKTLFHSFVVITAIIFTTNSALTNINIALNGTKDIKVPTEEVASVFSGFGSPRLSKSSVTLEEILEGSVLAEDTVKRFLELNTDVVINGALVSNNAFIGTDEENGATFDAEGNLILTGVLTSSSATISGAGSLGSLTVSGTSTLNGETNLDGEVNFTDTAPTITVTDASTLTLTDGTNTLLTLVDGGSVGNLTITGTTTSNGNLISKGTLAISGASTLSGAVTASSTLKVSGDTTLSGALAVSGASTLSGAVTASSTLKVSGATTISDTTQSSSTTTGSLIISGGAGIAKNVYIGGDLVVAGTTTTTGASSFTGQILASDGTVSAPGYSFSSDTDTGIYRSAANTLDFSSGGVRTLQLNTATTGVNYLSVTPAATGSGPTIISAGSDTNIPLTINSLLTGALTLDSTSTGTVNLGTGTSGKSVNIGTGAAANTITIGNNTSTSSLALTSGTGDIAISSTDLITVFPTTATRLGNSTDYASFSSDGDMTFVDADGAASITGPAGGTFSVVAGSSQALTLTGANSSTWSTSNGLLTVTGDDGITLNASSTAGITGNIPDNITDALDIQQGTNNYINISTSDTAAVFTIDLPVAGSSSTTGNLFTSAVNKTINISDSASTNTIDIGGVTNSGTDTISIATEGTAADVIAIGNTNASSTLALTGGDDWNMAATGILTMSASASQTTAIVITDTDYTNSLSIGDNTITGTTANIDLTYFDVTGSTGAVTIDPQTTGTYLDFTLETAWTTGDLINADYASATTLTGAVIGLDLDLDTNVTGVSGSNLTGVRVQTPVISSTASTTYNAFEVAASGALTHNTAGTLSWRGLDITMPNGTQTGATLAVAGVRAANGTLTTGGTQNIFHAVATGVGAGTLNALEVDGITGGSGTETAVKIGSGWDTSISMAGGTTGLSASGTYTTAIDLSSASSTTDLILDDGLTVAQTSDNDLDIVENSLTWNIDFAETTASTITQSSASAMDFTVSGDEGFTFTSSETSGTTTGSAFVIDATGITSGTGMYVTADALTTGKLAQFAPTGNTLTTGTIVDVRATATSLTGAAGTGSLVNLDWSPGSATTATGDLFALNIGTNGTTTGMLFNILDTASSIFSVSETAVTTSLPTNFTGSGDVGVANDLQFTNPTASYVKSLSQLNITAGETFNSSNLTLQTYNAGSVVINSGSSASTSTTGLLNLVANSTTSSHIGFAIDYTSDSGVTAAADLFAAKINITQNDADGDLFGLVITNQASTNAGADDVECLICVDNAENTASAVTDAIRITSTGVAAGITYDLKLQNSETITNSTDGVISLGVGAAEEVALSATALYPVTNDGSALGTSSLMWADLFLASGAVVNFNNGDVTLTHAADNLTIANTTQGAADLLAINPTWTADNTGDGLSVTTTYNVSASTSTVYGLNLVNADNTTNTGVIDALALFSNNQATETLADGVIIRHNASSGTLTDGLQIENTTAGGTITNAINILETAGTVTTGINIGSGVGTAISLQNGETIDNTTNNQIELNLGTSGTLLLTNTASVTGGATAIDFTEFDVSATTGSITINDGGDAGNVSVEGTILDINSLDFVGAGTVTSVGVLTLDPTTGIAFTLTDNQADALDIQEGTNNYINVNTTNSSENVAFGNATTNPSFSFLGTGAVTIAGSAEGTASLTQTAGDHVITDGDLTISGGEIAATSDDGTGTNFSFTTGALSTGTGLGATSSSNSYTTGKILDVSLTQSAATGTSVSGDISSIAFSPTYSTAITTPAISGNVADISRSSTTNSSFASTLTVSGAVVSIADTSTQTTGTLTHTGNVLFVDQNYSSSSGNVLSIENAGTGSGIALASSSTGVLATLDSTGAVTTADGILIRATHASGVITDGIDVSDDEIVNGINVGSNIILGAATAIDFTEFDVSASTGSITINDTGDAGNVSVEGTILDINSLDFVGAGTVTSVGVLTLDPTTGIAFTLTDNQVDALDIQEGTNNYFNVNTTNSSENVAFGNATTNPSFSFLGTGAVTIAGSAEGTASLTQTAGDHVITDGDLTISGGEISATTDDTTTTGFAFVANTITSGNALTLSGTGMTTGEILDLTGTWAPTDGSTNEAIDINFTHTPTTLADNFSAINLTTTDGTALGNTMYNYNGTLTLTGNADKTGIGMYQTVTSSSTTADTLIALDLATSVTGIIASGTGVRDVYGIRNQPSAGAESTADTTNVYGEYIKIAADVGAGGTVNGYGLYVANGTYDTDGTSTQTGLYVESPTGADTNYAAIFAGGNVGIGTTGPVDKLTIGTAPSTTHTPSGTGVEITTNTPATDAGTLVLFGGDAVAANIGGKISFGGTYTGTTDTTWAHIAGLKENATDGQYGGYMTFSTRANGSSEAEHMRIDSVGNVGIGTTAPSGILQLGLSTTAAIYKTYTASSTNQGLILDTYQDSSSPFRRISNIVALGNQDGSAGGSEMTFQTNPKSSFTSAIRMIIKEDGNVGIGITSPASKLDIDTGSNTLGLRLRGTAETTEIGDIYVGSGGEIFIDATAGNDVNQYIDIRPEDDQFGLILRDGTGASAEYANFFMTNAATDYLNIVVGAATSTTGLVIQNGGNVGIGTTNPGGNLHVHVAAGSNPSIKWGDGDVTNPFSTLEATANVTGTLTHVSTTAGGAVLNGYTSGDTNALILRGLIGSTDPTDTTAAVEFRAGKLTGTTGAALGSLETAYGFSDWNASTRFMTILGSGNVGVRTQSPGQELDVAGDIQLDANGTATGNGICHSGADSDTTFADRDLVACTDTVGDLAEWYETKAGIEAGDIVSMTSETIEYSFTPLDPFTGMQKEGVTITERASILNKSENSNDTKVIGIVSTSPYQAFGDAIRQSPNAKNPQPIALVGRVPVKVSSTSDPIQPGDLLTTSTEPGKAIKATKAGFMIGKALEAWDPSSGTDKVLVFVTTSYADPTDALAKLLIDTDGKLLISELKIDKLTINSELNLNGSLKINGTTVDTSALTQVGTLASALEETDGEISNIKYQISNLESKESTNSAEIATAKSALEELKANLASQSAELAQAKSDIEDLELTPAEYLFSATASATLASINVTEKISTLDLLSSTFQTTDATISGTFKALGEALLPKTTIAGDVTVDGTFSITDGHTINSLGTLFLQSSPLAALVDFFNGLVTIDNTGKILAQEVAGVKITANKLTITTDAIASGSAVISDPTIGTSSISSGQTEVAIITDQATETAKILLTARSSGGETLFVKEVVEGAGFVVSLSSPAITQVTFDWLLIETQ